MDHTLGDAQLVRELASIGLDCGVQDSAIVRWHSPSEPSTTDSELASLVVAAHEEPDGSEAVAALKARLAGQSEKRAAYVAERNREQRTARQERYREVTDPLLFEALEDAALTANGAEYEMRVPTAEWDAWLAAKAAIREELPYPIEE